MSWDSEGQAIPPIPAITGPYCQQQTLSIAYTQLHPLHKALPSKELFCLCG